MYIFIENNNTKNGQKKERRKKRVEKDSIPAPPARLHLADTPQRLIT